MKDNFKEKKKVVDQEVLESPETKPENEITTEVEEPENEITTEVEEPPKKEKVLGTVVNCPRLRVREHPSINAVVAAEIDEGSEVVINEDKSAEEFYSVITATGLEGYCMKDYIQLK